MPSIYCDICGAHFRKGKTFHEHLKKSKCTRVSALISVLQNHSDIEVNNPGSEKSIKQETVLECQISDVAGASNSEKASNQGDEQTDSCADLGYGILDKTSVKQEKNESDFGKRSTNSRKIETVDSDSESSLSDTGFEEVEVTPNGDILIFSSDNDESDFSDEVDWDYLESTGKVETFRQNEELQVEANSTLDEPSKTAKKKGETLTKRKKRRQSKPNFEHSDRSAKKQCLLLDKQKTESVYLGRPTTRSVELQRTGTKSAHLGRPATRSVQIGRKDSKFKELSTSFIVTRKSKPKFPAKTVDIESRLGRKTKSHINTNKNNKRDTVCQNKPKVKTANKRKRTHSNSGYDEKGKDKAGEKVLTTNLWKRVRKTADPKQNNCRNKNFNNNNTLISKLQNTQRLRHINNTLTDSKFKKREPSKKTRTSNSRKNSSDRRGQEFIEKKKLQVRCDVNKLTEDHTKNSANINKTPQRGKNDKHIVNSINKNMKCCRIQKTNFDNNASESDLEINTETHTTENKEVTVKKNKRNIESESSSDEESSIDIAISSKGNETDEDQDIENDETDTDFFIESDNCSDSDVDKQVTRSRSRSKIPPTTETGQESTVVLDNFSSINDHKSGCEVINQTEQTEDCDMSKEGEELQSFVCGICHQSFPNSDSLEAHIFTHCDNGSPVEQNTSEFICGICSTIYKCNEDLENHMVVHMDKSVNKSMSEPTKQNVSERKKQKSLYTLVCGKCKQEFSNAKSFHQHLMTHFALYESIDDTEVIQIEENDISENSDNDQTENADSETCNELIDIQNENGKYADNTTSIETNKERAEISVDNIVNDITECETSREIAVESIDQMNDDEVLKTKESKESDQLLVEEKTEKEANSHLLQDLLQQNDEVGTKKADNPPSDLKIDDAQSGSLGTTPSKSTTQSFSVGSIIYLTKENDDNMVSKINDDNMLKRKANKERNQLMSEEKKGKKVSNSCSSLLKELLKQKIEVGTKKAVKPTLDSSSSLLKELLKQKIEVGTKKADKPMLDALGSTLSKSKSKSFIDGSIIDLTKTPSSPVSDVGDMVNGTSPSILAKESSIRQQPQEVHLEKESKKDTSTAILHDSNINNFFNKSDQVLDMSSSKKSKIVVQTQNELMIPVSVSGKSKKLQSDCPVLIPLDKPMVKKINQNFTSMLLSAEIPGIPGHFSTDSPIVIPVTFQGNLDKLKTDQPMVIPLKIPGNKAKKDGKDEILIPVNLQANGGKQVVQWSGNSKINPEKIQTGSPGPVTYQSGQMPVISQGVQVPVTSQSEQAPITVQSGQVQGTMQSEQVPKTSQSGQVPVIVESGQVPVTMQSLQVPITSQSGRLPVTMQSWQMPLTSQSGHMPATMQSVQVPITSQSGQLPVTMQSVQVPITSQSGQLPVTSRSGQVPITSQGGQLQVTRQNGLLPVTNQSGQVPVTMQSGQVPVTSPTGQVPVTLQSGQRQVTSQSEQVLVTDQSEQVPGIMQSVNMPTTMQSGQVPVTKQSGQVLVTMQNGHMPVTTQSGQVPVTTQSGKVPVTMQSAQVPVTNQSGQVAVTLQSALVSVTSQNGQVPVKSLSGQVPVTVQSGQVPVTSHSGQVLVILQSGQVPVTNQSGKVPVTSQSGQMPVTSQSQQAPITSWSGLDNLIMDKLGPVTEKTENNTKKLALVNSEMLSCNKKNNTPKDVGDEQTISSSGHKEKQKEDSREMIINKLMNYKPKFFMD